MAIISTYVLLMNEYVCRCAPCYFVFVGSDITYNQCYPYEVSKFGKIKVCGPDTVVKIYLRGRCEGDCMEVSPESNKWLKAAQYYVIEPVGEKKAALPKPLRVG